MGVVKGRFFIGVMVFVCFTVILGFLGIVINVFDGGLVGKVFGVLPRWVVVTACIVGGVVGVVLERLGVGGWCEGFWWGWLVVVLGLVVWEVLRVFGVELFFVDVWGWWGFGVVYSLGFLSPLLLVFFGLSGFLGYFVNKGKVFAALGEGDGGVARRYGGLAGALLAFVFGALLFAPWLNPSGRIVGVDPSHFYGLWFAEARRDIVGTLWRRFDRPLFIVLLWLLGGVLGVEYGLRVLVVFGLVFWVLSVYLFVREFFGGGLAGFAGLLAPVSFNFNVVLHAGYYNNLLASGVFLLSLVYLRRWLEGRSRWWVWFLLFEAGVFLHGYMGLFFGVVLVLYGLRGLGEEGRLYLGLGLLGVLESFWRVSGYAGGAVARNVGGWWFSGLWWENVVFTVFNCAPGAAVEPWGWVLAVVGGILAGDALLNSWLVVGGGLSLFAGYGDWVLRQRAIFAVPVPVYEAVGFRWVYGRCRVAAWALYLGLLAHTLGYVLGLLGV